MYARRRVFHRDGRHYRERLEYTLFHPFPSSPEQQTFVYFKDTLALALLKPDYKAAHEIISLVGGWIYNGTGYEHECDIKEAGHPDLTPAIERTVSPMKDMSHTACFLEGYYRQWFAPNAVESVGMDTEFVNYHVFKWDWEAKYRRYAEHEGMTELEHKHLIRNALFFEETPVWMTIGVHLRRAEKMCTSLATRFMDYIHANPKD